MIQTKTFNDIFDELDWVSKHFHYDQIIGPPIQWINDLLKNYFAKNDSSADTKPAINSFIETRELSFLAALFYHNGENARAKRLEQSKDPKDPIITKWLKQDNESLKNELCEYFKATVILTPPFDAGDESDNAGVQDPSCALRVTNIVLIACNEGLWPDFDQWLLKKPIFCTSHKKDLLGKEQLSLVPVTDIAEKTHIKKPYAQAAYEFPLDHIKTLSISAIQLYLRDPLAFYIRYSLGLKPEITGNEKGLIYHDFLKRLAHNSNSDVNFNDYLEFNAQSHFWQEQFKAIYKSWLKEKKYPMLTEIRGMIDIKGIKIEGIADRIDIIDGTKVRIIDYKTGQLPTKKQVASYEYPQLPILGYFAKEGAFGKKFDVDTLQYYQIKGYGDDPLEIVDISTDVIDSVPEFLENIICDIFSHNMTPKFPNDDFEDQYVHFKR